MRRQPLTPEVYRFHTIRLDASGEVVERPAGEAQLFHQDLGRGVSLEMVRVPGGPGWVGSLHGQGEAEERPQHRVEVAAFWLWRHPVSQAQWQAVMGRHVFRFEGAQRPAENIAWTEAAQFCARLAGRAGRAYRLPSEAEWEMACRAGTRTPFAFGETLSTEVANYVGNHTFGAGPLGVYRHVTTEAGMFPPNAFGLHDMHANVWEWCADLWHPNYEGAPADGRAWLTGGEAGYRVARGGCWHDPPAACRSAARLRVEAAFGEDFVGFRVALADGEVASP